MKRSVLTLLSEGGYAGRALLGLMQYARERREWDVRRPRHEFTPESLREFAPAGIVGQLASRILVDLVEQLRIPVVNISRVRETPFPLVTMDNVEIGRMAARHFIDRGYTHLACSTGDTLYASERLKGFREEAEAQGLRVREMVWGNVVPRGLKQIQTERNIASWLRTLPKPCGFFAAFWGAENLSLIARLAELRVPEDLGLLMVGDDSERCEREDPPVSSVDFPAERIGYKAAELLDDLMNGRKTKCAPLLLKPTVVTERASTSIVTVSDPEVLGALNLIRQRACKGFEFAELEREIPISRRTLERRFRRLLGRTMQEELLRVQLEQAKYLLTETDMSLEMVAMRSGMSGSQRLCHVFKEQVGMTPRQFRMNGRPMG